MDKNALYLRFKSLLILNSTIDIATRYGLDDQGVGVRVPVESRIFTFPIIQTGSGTKPASYPTGTGAEAARDAAGT
jgi:hypothetical protein